MRATQTTELPYTLQLTRARAALLIVAAVACAMFLTWVMFRRQPGVPRSSAFNESIASASTQNQTPAISATLTANGFTPAHATCSPGKVRLVISNQSSGNLVLRLSRSDGQPMTEFGVSSATGDLRQEVSLDAGEYTLKERNHSAWVLQITAQ